MSQFGFLEDIGTDWVDTSDDLTFTATNSYIVQNRGSGVLLLQESSSEPTDDAGLVLPVYETYKYTNETGVKLWVKAISGTCAMNVVEA